VDNRVVCLPPDADPAEAALRVMLLDRLWEACAAAGAAAPVAAARRRRLRSLGAVAAAAEREDVPPTSRRLAEARELLDATAFDSGRFRATLNQVADCAEKHYLRACGLLRADGLGNRRSVVEALLPAIRQDPSNPVYAALFDDLAHLLDQQARAEVADLIARGASLRARLGRP
jgi:hypothetical protein